VSPIRVWDAPIRLVHWAMVLLIPLSWWTATQSEMDRHRLCGYVWLGLLLFRLLWGLFGSETARFAGFVRGPRAVYVYARGRAAGGIGHNPLGGWSVIAMLAAIAAQIGLGLFAVDEDGLESGPLSYLVSFDTGRRAAGLHSLNFWLILFLVALHIGAILFYRIARGKNLVAAMIHGRARVGIAADPPKMAPLWRAAAAAAVAGLAAWWVSSGLRL
jgi:cytochrome b